MPISSGNRRIGSARRTEAKLTPWQIGFCGLCGTGRADSLSVGGLLEQTSLLSGEPPCGQVCGDGGLEVPQVPESS